MKSLGRFRPSATPWTAAFQAPPSMGFSRQEYWIGVPLSSPRIMAIHGEIPKSMSLESFPGHARLLSSLARHLSLDAFYMPVTHKWNFRFEPLSLEQIDNCLLWIVSWMPCCCSVTKHVWLFVTPWNAICQASPSFAVSQSLLKLMCIESVVPTNHLILCHPLLLLECLTSVLWPHWSSGSLLLL